MLELAAFGRLHTRTMSLVKAISRLPVAMVIPLALRGNQSLEFLRLTRDHEIISWWSATTATR
jgi:hypothetical protein